MTKPARSLGDYLLHEPIGSGGMAEVHFGQRLGAGGFARTVAIKRIRTDRASDPGVRATLVDEVRLLSRVYHPNVVPTIDAILDQGELFVVLEYVHGESLARLLGRLASDGPDAPPVPIPVVVAIAGDLLRGLHAAHEATGPDGAPLELIHRDVCPHNVLVDVHGVARILDFGIAKAKNRVQETTIGQIKGRLQYLAPEQIHGQVTRRSDLYSLGVVLWEAVTQRRLFHAQAPGAPKADPFGTDRAVLVGASDGEILAKVLGERIPPPSATRHDLPEALDRLILRALDRRPDSRFATAAEMLAALDQTGVAPASRTTVGDWVRAVAGPSLAAREVRAAALAGPGATDPEDSEATEQDVAPPRGATADRENPQRARIVAAALAGAVVLGALLGLFRMRDQRSPAGPVPDEPPPPPRGSVATPGPTDETDEPTEPTPAGSAAAKRAPARPVHGARHPPAPKSPCSPPYEVDSTGVKVYKRECFPLQR